MRTTDAITNQIAETWLNYFDFVGFSHHDEIDRFAIWLAVLGYSVEQVQQQGITRLAEEEQERFLGQYASPADFAEESYGNAYSYELEALPDSIRNAIDWARVWDSELRHDCNEIEINDDAGYRSLIWHTAH